MANKKESILKFADLGSNNTGDETESDLSASQNTDSFLFAPVKKLTVEETHVRRTWLIRSDLVVRLDRLAEDQGKGFSTQLVNQALDFAISELEKRQ